MKKVIKLAQEIIATIDKSDAADFEKKEAVEMVGIMRRWRGTTNFVNERQGITEKVLDFGFPPGSLDEGSDS